jgi:preprotein translocase subunit SecG
MLQSVLLGLHIVVALSLIGLILIQHGKGADAGAAFGSGASSTVFGAQGATGFLTKATAMLATVFFVNCFVLAWLSSQQIDTVSLMDRVTTSAPAKAPAAGDIPVVPDDAATPAVPVPAAEVPVVPAESK